MNFRFTLSNDTLGAFVLPSDPIGWEKSKILFKRSPKYHGVFYQDNIDLQFFCGSGLEYIEEARALGVDTVVILSIYIACGCESSADAPDYSIDYSDDYGSGGISDCVFEEFYEGKLDLKTCSILNNKLSVNIIQNNIVDTILNRMDTPVNLSKLETLDGTTLPVLTYGPYTMSLHSKVIVFLSELSSTEDSFDSGSLGSGDIFNKRAAIAIVLPVKLTELPDIQQYVSFLSFESAFSSSFPDTLYTAFEAGTYTIEYKLLGVISEFYLDDREYSFLLGYRINEINDPYNLINIGPTTYAGGVGQTFNIDLEGTLTLSMNQGDTFSFFAWIDGFDNGGGVDRPVSISETFDKSSFIRIKKETTTPDTTANVHAIFEAGAGIFRSYANQLDVFRSAYYGRKNSEPYAYSSNGCGSFRAITNGALIRNFPIADRPVRITGNEYFDSLNAIDNLGLGIERVAGVDYVVMEPKSYFYSNTLLFQLSNVPNMKISEGQEYYYNRFECGYEKWQIEQRGGLDEVNSKREYDLGLKTIDNPLIQVSSVIAGAYPLEIARRKQYPDSFTEDADTDNNNFIICLNKSVDVDGVPSNLTIAEKDENFTQVNNVLSPSTSYNLDISPARNTLRWSPVLNVGLLKYPGRNYKFVYGEGNFKMASQMTSSDCPGSWNNELLSEGQDIQSDDVNNTDNNPLWIPLVNSFRFPLTRTQAKILQNNPNGYIEVSNTDTGHEKWYILEADYSPVGGMTEFKLLKKWQ